MRMPRARWTLAAGATAAGLFATVGFAAIANA